MPSQMTTRAQRKREQILSGAQRLFLTHGYTGTSTDAIAKEAAVSKETLYAYYPNKEALLAAVLQHLVDTLSDEDLTITGTIAFKDKQHFHDMLIELAQRIITNAMQPDYLALVRIILGESARVPQLGLLFRNTIPMQGLTALSHFLEQAQQQKIVQIADFHIAARMFIGPLLTYILVDGLMVANGAPQPPGITQITTIVDLYLKTLS
jgi:AcrR family transcriptional regulator